MAQQRQVAGVLAELGKWLSNDRLRVYLAGFAYGSNDPDDLETINLTYDVVIQISGSTVIVANVSARRL